ncbi:glycolate oxidase FAD binding subunit [Natronocella acetinitrilica]|uniref:Glycolate oxidase FAD binding subunit n=1 Tax=Natronocella acetinitrilica TaxID=414046 RepID=A0AAE3G5M2_9GAMM|nr:glycolate oxidase subunit GlcE [Natronocella acetinitrilica]MCP1676230.1 glycolate oxidase FAD binding subunit [Natronocella acetinitrilica]
MSDNQDRSTELVEQVRAALAAGTRLAIQGGGSKSFYGRAVEGEPVTLQGHTGIVNYEPTELVLTARAGTPLREVESVLTDEGQMMPFDPPDFDGNATVGGAFAAGLSGPARPWHGSARDLILGMRLINGRGEHNRYGGEVMKNVAGYDVSRVVTGSLGTLGVITEISMKVLPRPEAECTLVLEQDPTAATLAVENWFREGMPVTGAAMHEGRLHLRLAGSASAVRVARERIGGEKLSDGSAWWQGLRDQTLPFFASDLPLWRISLPPSAGNLDLDGDRLFDWNGQLRWLYTATPAAELRERASSLGGHATLFRGGAPDAAVFHPLTPGVHTLNQRLKQAFDPDGIFNRGRMYADI